MPIMGRRKSWLPKSNVGKFVELVRSWARVVMMAVSAAELVRASVPAFVIAASGSFRSAPLPANEPLRFTPLAPFVRRQIGNCDSASVPEMLAAATEPAENAVVARAASTAYGVAV